VRLSENRADYLGYSLDSGWLDNDPDDKDGRAMSRPGKQRQIALNSCGF
jgi:hypothetical protein